MANIKKQSIADTNIKNTLSHLDQLRALQLESEQYSVRLKKQELENKEVLNKWTQLLKEKEVVLKKLREEDYLRQREQRLEKEKKALQESKLIDFNKSSGLQWISGNINGPVGSKMTNLTISALTGGLINPIIANQLNMHKLVEYSLRGVVGLANLTKKAGWEYRSNSALKNERENTPTFRKLDDIYKVVLGLSNKEDSNQKKKSKSNSLSNLLSTFGTAGRLLLAAITGFGITQLLSSDSLGSRVKDFIAGAIPGLLHGGIFGALLGGVFSLGANQITEWWNDFTGASEIKAEENKNLTRYIVGGAVTGLGFGGMYGALLGAAVGGIAYLIFGKPKEFENDAKIKAYEDNRITAGIISGAILGLKFGGIYGAFVGALIGGAGVYFWNAIDKFQRDPTNENLKETLEETSEAKKTMMLGLSGKKNLRANNTPSVNGQKIDLRNIPKVSEKSPVFKTTTGIDAMNIGPFKYNPATNRYHYPNGKMASFSKVNQYMSKAKYGAKGLGIVSLLVDPTLTTLEYQANKDYYEEMGIADREFTRAVAGSTARTAAGFTGATLGGKGGAALGAAIGTLIFPGAGTAVGAALGGLIGMIGGGYAGSTIADKAVNYTVDKVYGDTPNGISDTSEDSLQFTTIPPNLLNPDYYNTDQYELSTNFGLPTNQKNSILLENTQDNFNNILNGEDSNSYKSLLVQEEMRDVLSMINSNQIAQKDTLQGYIDKNNEFLEAIKKINDNAVGNFIFPQLSGGGSTI